MPSQARISFDKNASDIGRLLDLHTLVGGTAKGRRHKLEVLNKSAIVLITAFWEAYCEDVAAEGLAHIVKHAKTADDLPIELRRQIAKDIKKNPNEIEVWKVADQGWRQYISDRFTELKDQRDRRLNTPKTTNINDLFRSAVGIETISNNWRWARKMTAKRAGEKLDKFVELRGSIAHRGQSSTSVKKAQVVDYFEFVKSLAGRTGGAVNAHVKRITGKPLW